MASATEFREYTLVSAWIGLELPDPNGSARYFSKWPKLGLRPRWNPKFTSLVEKVETGADPIPTEQNFVERQTPLADETPIFFFGNAVGISCYPFEAFAIEDTNLISAGLDQLLSLETFQRFGHSRPPHPQHQRQEFVGE
jgi:hypothetical protein